MNPQTQPVIATSNVKPHFLVIEDVVEDYQLLQHEMQAGGLSFSSTRVDADDDLFRELKGHPPDVVLSDNALVNADSLTVLQLVRNRCPDVPFLVVTGGMEEGRVAAALERGADDVILKHELSHLVPAVQRALRLGVERRRFRLVEFERDQLRREVALLRGERRPFSPLSTMCSSCKKIRDPQGDWETVEKFFMRQCGIQFSHGLCPDCVDTYFSGVR